jgi:hypothetical protein
VRLPQTRASLSDCAIGQNADYPAGPDEPLLSHSACVFRYKLKRAFGVAIPTEVWPERVQDVPGRRA